MPNSSPSERSSISSEFSALSRPRQQRRIREIAECGSEASAEGLVAVLEAKMARMPLGASMAQTDVSREKYGAMSSTVERRLALAREISESQEIDVAMAA